MICDDMAQKGQAQTTSFLKPSIPSCQRGYIEQNRNWLFASTYFGKGAVIYSGDLREEYEKATRKANQEIELVIELLNRGLLSRQEAERIARMSAGKRARALEQIAETGNLCRGFAGEQK